MRRAGWRGAPVKVSDRHGSSLTRFVSGAGGVPRIRAQYRVRPSLLWSRVIGSVTRPILVSALRYRSRSERLIDATLERVAARGFDG